jgi:uncharacterized membrane protein YoaK (UPF0700 family)
MQPPVPATSRIKAKSPVALWLTFSAGVVDIVGYIAIYHIFVAHMTGTTVQLGNKLVLGDWDEVVKSGVVLACFVVGSIFGRSVIEVGARQKRRRVASVTLVAEAVLVLVAIWLASHAFDLGSERLVNGCILLGLLASAMGLQTAILTKIGPLTIHTTFVTGMLNKLAQALSEWFFWLYDAWQTRATVGRWLAGAKRHTAFHNAMFMAAIWLSYIAGSIAGTWMDFHWKMRALYVPATLMLASCLVDQFRPLSIEEEKEQT